MSFCTEDDLLNKIQILNKTLWERKIYKSKIDEWLDNFHHTDLEVDKEQKIHALYLLSLFMYFGSSQIRALLKALFRDKFKYPIVETIRKNNTNTTDLTFIEDEFIKELDQTRFLPIGNPSESGSHILYYFRQENDLDKDLFINTHEIFDTNRSTGKNSLKNKKIKRYIFIDDFCGTGHQAEEYSRDIVDDMLKFEPNLEIHYLVLFATSEGMDYIRNRTKFVPKCVFELDNSFKCFSVESRYFYIKFNNITKDFAEKFSKSYGKKILPLHPLGYNNSQLLIGFAHNVPDNTLPIIWGKNDDFKPIFKRYHKL